MESLGQSINILMVCGPFGGCQEPLLSSGTPLPPACPSNHVVPQGAAMILSLLFLEPHPEVGSRHKTGCSKSFPGISESGSKRARCNLLGGGMSR